MTEVVAMTRTEVCENRVNEIREKLERLQDRLKRSFTPERRKELNREIAWTTQMLIAEEDHLEYARKHMVEFSKMKDALVRIRDQSHESHWAGADQPMMSPDTGLPWVHWREIAREVLEEIEDE